MFRRLSGLAFAHAVETIRGKLIPAKMQSVDPRHQARCRPVSWSRARCVIDCKWLALVPGPMRRAGSRNRTGFTSLEGWRITNMRYPRYPQERLERLALSPRPWKGLVLAVNTIVAEFRRRLELHRNFSPAGAHYSYMLLSGFLRRRGYPRFPDAAHPTYTRILQASSRLCSGVSTLGKSRTTIML